MADRDYTWDDEDTYWRTNYRNRPYAASGDYERFRPGYRFGFDSASKYRDRNWNDVEPELQRNWNGYADRGESTWEQIKDAVKDAWDRVTGRRPVAHR